MINSGLNFWNMNTLGGRTHTHPPLPAASAVILAAAHTSTWKQVPKAFEFATLFIKGVPVYVLYINMFIMAIVIILLNSRSNYM